MYRDKKISLVIPAYKEEKLIQPTLANVPDVIDRIYVVDDCSPDNQNEVILGLAQADPRIALLKHTVNQGPGGAIITGYRQSALDGYDIAVVVGGDHQMDLSEVRSFLDPIIDGRADYVKGNRFILKNLEDTLSKMPKIRLVANWVISALTKIASGFYKTMDVVEGYTAISKLAIETINWDRAWKRYGYPMDFLIRMNAYGFRVLDIPRTAIYLPGERQSKIKGLHYALTVSPMLLKGFFWRLKFKYLYHDFHPLVLFYAFSFLLIPLGMVLGGWLVADWLWGQGTAVTGPRAILTALLLISGFQFLLFAMFFDMEDGINK
jgi:glycosyltransferase involved in cell wall biosynthesis